MPPVSHWRTSLGHEEINRIIESIKNEKLSQGSITQEFEERFAQAMKVNYAVATTSGSVALLLALMGLGISSGDEVIVPNITFIATAHAAMMLGAKVVLVDTKNDLPILDVSKVEEKITKKTKAIMPVHLNGRSVDMIQLKKLSEKYGLLVVEDACQAMFSKNGDGFLGTQSNAGCFSLGVTKFLTTAQGGMVTTNDWKLYERMKLLKTHGVESTFAGCEYNFLGFNFKYTDIQAAIGIEQLKRIDTRKKHVIDIYKKYYEGLKQCKTIRLIPTNLEQGELPLYIDIQLEERDKLMNYLENRGIQARPIYMNLHRSPHLCNNGEFNNSARLQDTILYLPSGVEQPLANIDFVLSTIVDYEKTLTC